MVLVFSFWLTASSGLSVSAETVTRTLTPSETRMLIGDTIAGKYYNGTEYIDFNFAYGGAGTILEYQQMAGNTPLSAVGTPIIYYTAQIAPSLDRNYIQVDLQPQYSFFDTDCVRQTCGLSFGNYVSPVYSSPSWRWRSSFNGEHLFENTVAATYRATCRFSTSNSSYYGTFVDAEITNSSLFSAYSYRVCFYGNNASNGFMYFFITCPTVSDESTMASGTFGTTTSGNSGSGDITVNVDVDMTEKLMHIVKPFKHKLITRKKKTTY